MIDILTKVLNKGVDLGQDGGGLEPWDILTPEQALTAIYEIGLSVIGADDKIGDPVEDSSIPMQFTEVGYRNSLRKEQRKAWAKACGVAEK